MTGLIRNVFIGIFDHSSRSTFVKSDTGLGREALARQTLVSDEKPWLAVSVLIHPKGVLSD